MKKIRLDDLYHMVAHIYSEQNAERPASITFSHFVEVCGMLTIHDRRKKKEGLSVDNALLKALGWFFPLMAKFRVLSLEELIFRKYPYVCPYCRQCPHDEKSCKTVRGTERTVDHKALQQKYTENKKRRPISLNDWQRMFQDIYPRTAGDRSGISTIGLFEEIGELAESIRVWERYPKYFAGEAADVFSYLMGIANEHSLRMAQELDREFSLEDEFISKFPGLCVHCGYQVCICPSIPEATVGRMSKELDIDDLHSIYAWDSSDFSRKASIVASEVLDGLGGYSSLTSKFPFDRGEAKEALVSLCLKLADALKDDPKIAQGFRSIALTAASSFVRAGSRSNSIELEMAIKGLKELWPRAADKLKMGNEINPVSLTLNHIARSNSKRVLLVFSNPKGTSALRLQGEERAVKEAIKRSLDRDSISFRTLPAATIDDLRRALLEQDYDIVHFSGHGDNSGKLLFENEAGESVRPDMDAFSELIKGYPVIQCVILNACYSLVEIDKAIAPITIGMEAPVGDEAAIEFARGFYDAIGAGKDYKYAIVEGQRTVALKGFTSQLPIKFFL